MSKSLFTHEDRDAVTLLRTVFARTDLAMSAMGYQRVRDLLDRVQREVEAAPPPPAPGWYLWDDVEAVYYPGTGDKLFIRSDLIGRFWSSIHDEDFHRLTVLRLDDQEGSES